MDSPAPRRWRLAGVWTSLTGWGDFADRLSCQVTAGFLALLVAILGAVRLFGTTIRCWTPQEFSRAWEEYTNSYCSGADTYYKVPAYTPAEAPTDVRRGRPSFYQWAPTMLIVQASMCILPCIIWQLFARYSGFDVRSVLQTAAIPRGSELIADYLHRCIKRQRRVRITTDSRFKRYLTTGSLGYLICGRPFGVFLTVLYCVVKFLYLLSCIAQMCLIKSFTGACSPLLSLGIDWGCGARAYDKYLTDSLPRDILCDIQIRKLGKIERYTVQCHLPMNAFLEIALMLLWLWLLLLAVANLVSLAVWLTRLVLPDRRSSFVRKHLNSPEESDRRLSWEFFQAHLRVDGVFLLRILSSSSGEIFAGGVVRKLWEAFIKDKEMASSVCENLLGIQQSGRV